MHICRFTTAQSPTPRFGIIDADTILPLANGETIESFPSPRTDAPVPATEANLIAPVAPSKIICVGRNYQDHAAELGNPMPAEPLLFLKAPSSIIGHSQTIVLPAESSNVQHEGELGIVIGRTAHHIRDKEDALSYVLGYTCVNDVTARDLQKRDVQFTRAKSFDTFCPVGPVIVTDINPDDVEVTARVNGEVRQHGHTSNMAFSVAHIIRYISRIMTLLPGDLISTGTPSGVSTLRVGDVAEVEVSGIGILRNEVGKQVTWPAQGASVLSQWSSRGKG
jgi:2-keto-4-pentenoate hydratase/2-oxohepta-3-ene-1,7-dioic acid hydratase in catechol pathway